MTNPTELAQEEPSSKQERQHQLPPPQERNSPHDVAPDTQETTPGGRLIHETDVTDDQSKKSDIEGNPDVKSEGQGGNQEQTTENETQEAGETEGNEGDNVNSQGGGDLQKEKNVSQTDEPVDKYPGGNQVHDETSAAAAGGNIGSSVLISYRKRGRRDGNPIHVASTSGSKPRKKAELELPSCSPTCYVCKKPFGSWKAVFGHLRAHQRPTPGAFPPPTFTPPKGSPEKGNDNGVELALKEQLAPTLLNLARQTMEKMSQDHSNSAPVPAEVASSASSRSRGLSMDLNEPRTSVLLDLNEPAPTEKEDDIEEEDRRN